MGQRRARVRGRPASGRERAFVGVNWQRSAGGAETDTGPRFGERGSAARAKQAGTDRIAGFGCTAADRLDISTVEQEFNHSPDEVIRALVGIAFLEEHSARGQLL